jgi:hypothetical protein
MAADPETKRQAEEELEEFKRNMKANHAATGIIRLSVITAATRIRSTEIGTAAAEIGAT